MNTEQRFNLISKVSKSLSLDLFYSGSNLDHLDKSWVIGMLSDNTLNDEKLSVEIERVKEQFPNLRELLEYNK